MEEHLGVFHNLEKNVIHHKMPKSKDIKIVRSSKIPNNNTNSVSLKDKKKKWIGNRLQNVYSKNLYL